MNVGPVLGVAVATTLTGVGQGHGLPLVVLAMVAAGGAVAGWALPKRSAVTINPGRAGSHERVPERR
jgi:hypothetical protein